MADNCEFHDVDQEIKHAIIHNCCSKRLRRYALREDSLTLDKLLAEAHSLEMSEVQATGMEEKLPPDSKPSANGIHLIKGEKKQYKGRSLQGSHPSRSHPQPHVRRNSQPTGKSTTCRKCGRTWPHKQGPCPAKGQTCRKCGKPNHFVKMCLTPVDQIRDAGEQRKIKIVRFEGDSSSSDEEYLYSTGKDKSKVSTADVRINDVEIEMIVDNGASMDILDKTTFHKVNHNKDIALQPMTKRLFAYGSQGRRQEFRKGGAGERSNAREKFSTGNHAHS